jgi:hypothetical protein
MKIKKQTAMLASFTLGTLLFASTALADITTKSGYEQLKDGLKVTAKKMSGEFESYTLDISYVLKDNGEILLSDNQVEKYDRKKNAGFTINTSEGISGNNRSNYVYSDEKIDIRQGIGPDDKIYVMEYTEPRELHRFSNPFEEDEAEDIERIADAIVGSLKDHVLVKENLDGSKELTGSLTEMQIPTLVNAVASFQSKQVFNNRNGMQREWPHLTQDIFVKQVTGTALIKEDGVMENILGTATLTGRDAQGQAHVISVEILGKLKDVNATTFAKPNLTGKEVVTTIGKNNGPELTNPQKFVGTFKNDIVIEKEGRFVKAGERILDVTKIDNQGMTGRYHEEIRPGFEGFVNKTNEFTFNGTFENEKRNVRFEIPNEKGGKVEGNLYFDDYIGKVSFHFNQPYMGNGPQFDSVFNPVLE